MVRKHSKRNRFVSASELGSVHFCPRSYYFNVNNAPSTLRNQSQRLRGQIAHEELSLEIQNDNQELGWFRRLLRWLFGWFK